MPQEFLSPQLDLLSEEYVLIQAWKKTSAYIRGHSWYADTLELDRSTVDLQRFLRMTSDRLKHPDDWSNDYIRIVPAPKTQKWRIVSTDEAKKWQPVDTNLAAKLRPLAHVAFAEQVAATAVMLCLADRVESFQGDPRRSFATPEARKRTVSYGNRLFCDADGSVLRHRWGSGKLYRAYFTDYESFLARPESAARDVSSPGRVVIAHSDLRQFYDRVSRSLIGSKLAQLVAPNDDPAFYRFAKRLLNWSWHQDDATEVASIAKASGRTEENSVVLPQGLVASGFFANVALLDFDRAMSSRIGLDLVPGLTLEDYCRYVDDIRVVLSVGDDSKDLAEVEQLVADGLQQALDAHAPGLLVAAEKTIATTFREDVRPIVRQSRRMRSIQHAVSGGFDARGGEEILASIQGLLGTQSRFTTREDSGWSFAPVPDVRDATVARFAAGRYRTTFRSLRPLLEQAEVQRDEVDTASDEDSILQRPASSGYPRTKSALDDDARAFALGLIDRWVEDPSNVRLLRIGLDLWPAEDVLRNVLSLLRPFTERGGKRKAPRRVAWYCLAEIFRAGATETAFVEDEECLPEALDPEAYRTALRQEAHRLLRLPAQTLPWYLRQQVLLFLAVSERDPNFSLRSGTRAETFHYRDLIRFLGGDGAGLTSSDYAILSILARRSYRDADTSARLALRYLTPKRLAQIAKRDPTFAAEISEKMAADVPLLFQKRSPTAAPATSSGLPREASLTSLVALPEFSSTVRNELSLLSLASYLLPKIVGSGRRTIEPNEVVVNYALDPFDLACFEKAELKIAGVRDDALSPFAPPDWCAPEERWRFQLGYLLRFLLTNGAVDVTRAVRSPSWKETSCVYRSPESPWYQRIHGSFSGSASFGDDWVPLSTWTEELLSALLAWPGVLRTEMMKLVGAGADAVAAAIDEHIKAVIARRGAATGLLILPVRSAWLAPSDHPRPLRGCVVQTAVPDATDFVGDLTLSSKDIRKKHRNHLSAALAAIERMLALRGTHHPHKERLDWLIFPELAVHPADVKTHLIPFARANKTIILAGLTYERVVVNQPLVNSALWVIPRHTPTGGVEVVVHRQGKCHLAPIELEFNLSKEEVCSFRPCQWVIEYEWTSDQKALPLCLTAAICYDATDLKLVSDLRERSDVFAIPALNKDVVTFDQMALALHYHMFQMVVVANNGSYGGSNAYLPYRDPYRKQMFHMHGQPQASISFFEIDPIDEFLTRRTVAKQALGGKDSWKYPPAGT